MHTLIQSSQQPCEGGVTPAEHVRNPFSDSVDCLLNFSIDINFHLFTFVFHIVEILATV